MAFFSRHQKRKHIVIDLGSHSIKTAIFEKPVSGLAPTDIQKVVTKLTSASKGRRAFVSLHELLTSLLDKEHNPEKIVIGIGPNIADISLQEWKIGPQHLRDALTPAHIQKYFLELFDTHRDSSHAFLGYPVSVEINGYPVDIHSFVVKDPSTIKEVTLRTIILRFNDEAGRAFAELKQMLSGVDIEFIPSQAIAAEVLAATCNIRNGILVDIGGSVTTLMFIHEGWLVQIASFPMGTERFSHRIVKSRGGNFVEAEDLARQYSHGLISKDDKLELSHVFSEEAAEWKKGFMAALETLYPVAPLPEDFYVYGGGSYLPEVRSALWSKDILKNFSSFESPRVTIVEAPRIFNSESLSGVVKGPEDVGLAALMYYSLYHKSLF